jgi:hypothetical protein
MLSVVTSGEEQASAWVRRYAVLAAACALYLVLMLTTTRFADFDEAFFKSAGREWAATGRFAAPELHGLLGLHSPAIDEVFGVYPPLYPFGFGLFARIFGFGWRQCVLYDAVIHVLLVALAAVHAASLAQRSRALLGSLVGLAVLFLGHPGRPDELAMAFGMGAILVLHPRSLPRCLLAGFIFGLCAGTSLGAATVLAPTVAAVILTKPLSVRQKLIALAAVAIIAAATFALVVAPVLLADANAWRQYVSHLHLVATEGGQRSLLDSWVDTWGQGKQVILAVAGAGLVGVTAPLLRAKLWALRSWLSSWGGPLAGLLVVVLVVPERSRPTYPWFVGPLLLSATAVTLEEMWLEPRSRRAALALGLVAASSVVASSAWFVVGRVVMLSLPQAQAYEVARRTVDGLVPAGTRILVSDVWWVLADSRSAYDVNWCELSADELEGVSFVVLTGNGSGAPGQPQPLPPRLASYVAENFEVALDELPREPTRLLGIRLTNSAYGFGPRILRRRSGR